MTKRKNIRHFFYTRDGKSTRDAIMSLLKEYGTIYGMETIYAVCGHNRSHIRKQLGILEGQKKLVVIRSNGGRSNKNIIMATGSSQQ